MTELDRIREARLDGCMEKIEYYWDEVLEKGRSLNETQLEDYKGACAALQCMGEKAKEYADFMLSLV